MAKIGLEQDPVEEIERNLLSAIGVAFKATFAGEGDAEAEMLRVQKLSQQRLDIEQSSEAIAA